ncbi:MAG: 4-hydroxy-tetrahydrodipicolinate synthase [Silvanigrellaceae bacterium]|nr:4-hydroxy-tetrahydrodipicolinate synthase [Silvanigrellaceae bacterium]
MPRPSFTGVNTALVTPFTKNYDVDFKALENLILKQKKSGIHGIVILGSTGENPTLTHAEQEQIIACALKYRSDDFQIYVGSGTNSTAESVRKSIEFVNFATKQGLHIDGLMAVVPYYNKPSQKGIFQHFHEIAQALPSVPLCIYNNPPRSVVNLTIETFIKLVKEHNNIVCIKEAAGNILSFAETRIALNEVGKTNVSILSGDDILFAPSLACGADGIISVCANAFPNTFLEMFQAAQQSDLARLKKINLTTHPIIKHVFSVTNPIGVKALLGKLGLCENVLRSPLVALEEQEMQSICTALDLLANNQVETLR